MRKVHNALLENNSELTRQNRELLAQLGILRSAYTSLKQRSALLRDFIEENDAMPTSSLVESASVVLEGMKASGAPLDAFHSRVMKCTPNAPTISVENREWQQVDGVNSQDKSPPPSFDGTGSGMNKEMHGEDQIMTSTAVPVPHAQRVNSKAERSFTCARANHLRQGAWKRGRRDPTVTRMQLNGFEILDHGYPVGRKEESVDLDSSKFPKGKENERGESNAIMRSRGEKIGEDTRTPALCHASLCTVDQSPRAAQIRGNLHPLVRDDACSPYWWLGFPNAS